MRSHLVINNNAEIVFATEIKIVAVIIQHEDEKTDLK